MAVVIVQIVAARAVDPAHAFLVHGVAEQVLREQLARAEAGRCTGRIVAAHDASSGWYLSRVLMTPSRASIRAKRSRTAGKPMRFRDRAKIAYDQAMER